MAINENTHLPNKHTLYLARSGYGKSQTLKRRAGYKARGERIVMWDNNRDHDGHHYDTMSGFFRALAKCHASGRGFRVAYCGEAAPDLFEDWARGVWSILDGRVITRLLVEEYSDCCPGPGALSIKKNKYHRRLWTQSRKYGGIIDATSQRPQLISKDSLGNAGQIYASSMDSSAATRIGKEIDCHYSEIRDCKPGEFFFWNGGPATKGRIFTPKNT